jgi:hypothetical protein
MDLQLVGRFWHLSLSSRSILVGITALKGTPFSMMELALLSCFSLRKEEMYGCYLEISLNTNNPKLRASE